jgi:hypothetical protein
MSPELYARQLAAGAWGISFANVFQAALGARHGVRRIIIANQVLQSVDLDSLSDLLRQYVGLQVYFLIDSMAQLRLIEAWRDVRKSSTVFTVLLELGIEGKRTGCRDHPQALALARAIRAFNASFEPPCPGHFAIGLLPHARPCAVPAASAMRGRASEFAGNLAASHRVGQCGPVLPRARAGHFGHG